MLAVDQTLEAALGLRARVGVLDQQAVEQALLLQAHPIGREGRLGEELAGQLDEHLPFGRGDGPREAAGVAGEAAAGGLELDRQLLLGVRARALVEQAAGQEGGPARPAGSSEWPPRTCTWRAVTEAPGRARDQSRAPQESSKRSISKWAAGGRARHALVGWSRATSCPACPLRGAP